MLNEEKSTGISKAEKFKVFSGAPTEEVLFAKALRLEEEKGGILSRIKAFHGKAKNILWITLGRWHTRLLLQLRSLDTLWQERI